VPCVQSAQVSCAPRERLVPRALIVLRSRTQGRMLLVHFRRDRCSTSGPLGCVFGPTAPPREGDASARRSTRGGARKKEHLITLRSIWPSPAFITLPQLLANNNSKQVNLASPSDVHTHLSHMGGGVQGQFIGGGMPDTGLFYIFLRHCAAIVTRDRDSTIGDS